MPIINRIKRTPYYLGEIFFISALFIICNCDKIPAKPNTSSALSAKGVISKLPVPEIVININEMKMINSIIL